MRETSMYTEGASMAARQGSPQSGAILTLDNVMSNFEIKMAVMDAMTDLLRKTPLDELSVDRICNAANISRATFYRYFKDKFAVGQWHVMYCSSLGTAKIGRTLSWREGYYITEAAIAERIDFYIHAARSKDYNSIDSYAPRMRRETLRETIIDHRHATLTERLKFEVDATVRMETYLLPHWHYGNYDITLEQACDWMTEMVPRELFDLLNTPLKPGLRQKGARL